VFKKTYLNTVAFDLNKIHSYKDLLKLRAKTALYPMTVWETGRYRANLYRQQCNGGGSPLLFLTAFTFPSSEDI